MKFRPCIDIHNGKVKQLVGGSLKDKGNQADENFVSEKDAAYYANLYKKDGIKGGHIIILNAGGSEFFKESKKQALAAIKAYPNGMQIGGGVTAINADDYIRAGATHVIVTSFVFKDGRVNYGNLKSIVKAVGKEHIVLDLSCRKKDGQYYIVTDRWQKFTDEVVNLETLKKLSEYCDEFLVHGVDVEGKSGGMEEELVEMLSKFTDIPITYAGGIGSKEQIEKFDKYYEMLIETNKVMNLTSITEYDEVIIKHFIDSLLVVNIFDINQSKKMIDVGTGAGFPGIPIKIMFPHLQITLLDSLNKRLKFLNNVIDELGLESIETVHGRAEDIARKEEFREQYDLCVSRAVANLSTLSEYCIPFIAKNGKFISYKSSISSEEIQNAKSAIKILGGTVVEEKTVHLPCSDMDRTFVVVNKTNNTGKKYPRKAGTPSKEPL